MRVICCGSRTWADRDAIWDRLDKLPRPVTIVHGGCPRGADALAESWARTMRYAASVGAASPRAGAVAIECHAADWDTHGRAAGMIRNAEMASLGADICIAFHDGKSRGTADMIRKAVAHGIPVEVIKP